MSIRRRVNWISQQRVEPHHLKSIESAVSSDFDELLATFLTGYDKTYIIRGFEANMTGAINAPASSISVIVGDSALLHGNSTTSGSFFAVPDQQAPEILNSITNPNVQGSFTPNSTNYVSLDFTRSPDPATSGPVTIRDVVAKTEIVKNLPLAQILKYKFVISNSGFSVELAPLFTVVTDASNNVVSITDHRDLLYRQGKPANTFYKFPWLDGRLENSSTSISNTMSPFYGGDKQLSNLKDWMDAVTSSIQEVKGTPYWYTYSTGGSLLKLRADATNLIITSKGVVHHEKDFPGWISWDHDILVKLVTSKVQYTLEANPQTLLPLQPGDPGYPGYPPGYPDGGMQLDDGEIAYIDLIRGVEETTTPFLFRKGSKVVTPLNHVWPNNIAIGDFVRVQGASDSEYYQVDTVSPTDATLKTNYQGPDSPATGETLEYTKGFYSVSDIKVAQRHEVPYTEDMFWFFFRDDNGGSVAKIYTRFKAGEIEQGESQEVSDNTSLQLLQFVGSTSESDNRPAYAVPTNPLVPYDIEIGDNLTHAISQLIQNVNEIFNIFDRPSYDETIEYTIMDVPPVKGDLIQLPDNTRAPGPPPQPYVMGKGALEVYLNGQFLVQNDAGGWYEVDDFGQPPTYGVESFHIKIDQDLYVGDKLTFRIDATGGPGSGSGSGSGAVDSVNFITGHVQIAAGSGINIVSGGNTITISSPTAGQPDDDFHNLPQTTSAEYIDEIPLYDKSVSDYRKIERGDFLAKNIVRHSDHNNPYMASDEADVILVDTTLGDVTIVLPSEATGSQKCFDIKKVSADGNKVIVTVDASGTIDGAAQQDILGYMDSITFLKELSQQYWMI